MTASEQERLIALAHKINRLRDELSAAEVAFGALFGDNTPPRAGPLLAQPPSLPRHVLEVMSMQPSDLFRAVDLARLMEKPRDIITCTLIRLARVGKIRRVRHGVYCVSSAT